jgi:F0F1-type ATP synthase membrane subunit b/b'
VTDREREIRLTIAIDVLVEREHRLRERIDQVTTERDAALAELADLRRLYGAARHRAAKYRRSADLWRRRALDPVLR